MEKKVLLAILGFGALVSVVSLILLSIPQYFIKNNMRYIAPLSPLAVAVYVYITKIYEIKMAVVGDFIIDLIKMSIISHITFFVLAICLYFFLKFIYP